MPPFILTDFLATSWHWLVTHPLVIVFAIGVVAFVLGFRSEQRRAYDVEEAQRPLRQAQDDLRRQVSHRPMWTDNDNEAA